MDAISYLSVKQKSIVSKNDITVEKVDIPDREEYVYFIAGVYDQQKGFATELDAYLAGIEKVLSKK